MWARTEPLLSRGREGAEQVDDRRVISGIVYMLKSGARWCDCSSEYVPETTMYNRFNRWSRQGIWLGLFEALTGHNGIEGTMTAAGAKGAVAQAVGVSRGGRISKLHGLTDAQGRPRLLMQSAGNVNDMSMAGAMIAPGKASGSRAGPSD